jgi:hypothetical protein
VAVCILDMQGPGVMPKLLSDKSILLKKIRYCFSPLVNNVYLEGLHTLVRYGCMHADMLKHTK